MPCFAKDCDLELDISGTPLLFPNIIQQNLFPLKFGGKKMVIAVPASYGYRTEARRQKIIPYK